MKILAVDGNSVVNRAFYGIRPLTTKDGQPTNAIHGFMSMLLKIMEETNPDGVAIAFDLKAPTFRHKLYDGYKAKRKGMPEELFSQMQPLQNLLAALGYKLLSAEGFEADDILGTLAQRCRETGDACVIATGDKDSLQLIGEGVTVRLLSTKAGRPESVIYDEEVISANFGVTPRSLIDIKAIQGDTSDNIPGVRGIGEKGALALIQKFGSLDGVYGSIDSDEIKDSMRKKLVEDKEMAYLSRTLGTVRTDAPVSLELSDYIPAPIDTNSAMSQLRRLEMFKMIERLSLKQNEQIDLFGGAILGAETPDIAQQDSSCVLFGEEAEALLPQVIASKEVSFLCECSEGSISELAVSFEGKTLILSKEAAHNFLSQVMPDPSIAKRTYDLKSAAKALITENIEICGCEMGLMLAAYILNPSASSYSYERLCELYSTPLPENIPPFMLLSAKAERFPEICRKLSFEIDKNNQKALLTEIEIPLAVVLADMEQLGFRVDVDGIARFGGELDSKITEITEEIYKYAGYEFNINSPRQVGEVLFGKLMLPGGKKTKTGYSTNAEVLEGLRGVHPVVDLIMEHRMLAKLNSTYCVGLQKAVAQDGRIHSSFNQTETRTGRISSTEPNLQNIPVRTELGSQMRKFFIANDGWLLADADYSQIELRVLAHCSNDQRMIDGFKSGEDIHKMTAAQVFGVPEEEVTPSMRSNAKAVNFGIVYGIGAFSLSKDLGISQKEASEYIKGYLRTYPEIDKYMSKMIADAKEKGYAETLYGRRRYLPELSSSNFNMRSFGERVARNMPIQGTAADIIKIAMVKVWRRLRAEHMQSRLVLQVHDELILECPESEAALAKEILVEEMRSAAKLSVELSVDGNTAKTWYDAKG
ncbi:MAG: DNA polymerase I [Oscillospiraceae bacterium]|nr:DNA polymerase I [Oscillospiraceae bacterium]